MTLHWKPFMQAPAADQSLLENWSEAFAWTYIVSMYPGSCELCTTMSFWLAVKSVFIPSMNMVHPTWSWNKSIRTLDGKDLHIHLDCPSSMNILAKILLGWNQSLLQLAKFQGIESCQERFPPIPHLNNKELDPTMAIQSCHHTDAVNTQFLLWFTSYDMFACPKQKHPERERSTWKPRNKLAKPNWCRSRMH